MRIVLALAIAALTLNSASAVEIDELVGHWCGGKQRLDSVFTPTDLAVIRYDGEGSKHGPVLKIAKVESGPDRFPDRIRTYWTPFEPGKFTSFELSTNKRQLIQIPNSGGDNGARRVFTRC
jgi:hypothetical protein